MRAALLVGEDGGREIMGVKMTVGFQRVIRVNGSNAQVGLMLEH